MSNADEHPKSEGVWIPLILGKTFAGSILNPLDISVIREGDDIFAIVPTHGPLSQAEMRQIFGLSNANLAEDASWRFGAIVTWFELGIPDALEIVPIENDSGDARYSFRIAVPWSIRMTECHG